MCLPIFFLEEEEGGRSANKVHPFADSIRLYPETRYDFARRFMYTAHYIIFVTIDARVEKISESSVTGALIRKGRASVGLSLGSERADNLRRI